jgi:protein TonB
MKLDILKNQWLDIVFEGRKKQSLWIKKVKQKNYYKALILGRYFLVLLWHPLIIDLLPKGAEEDMDRDIKITAIKLPPKKEEPKCSTPPHPTKSGSG